MKKIRPIIAWIMMIVIVCTNIDYVKADDVSDAYDENKIVSLETSEMDVSENALDDVDETEEISENNVINNEINRELQSAASTIASGTFRGMEWIIDGEGLLTISGNYVYEGDEQENPTWLDYASVIKSVKVTAVGVKSTYFWFKDCDNLEKTDFSQFDTHEVIDIGGMFWECSSLTNLDISGWDTASVTDMGGMFLGCSNLKSLDLSGWNTTNVTDMSGMFDNCVSLISLDVSNFNTSKVTKMDYMFWACKSLTSLDLSSFDATKATWYWMFGYNESLVKIKTFKQTAAYKYIPLPFDIMYDENGKEYTYFPLNSEGIWLFAKDPTGSNPDSGIWQGIKWSYESSGTLYLSSDTAGGVAMPDLDYNTISSTPWYQYKDQINKIVIGEEITYIGNYSFDGYGQVKEIEIVKGVTAIGRSAFYKCTSLKKITIPSSVTQINDWAFAYDEALETIKIPEGVTEIGESMFRECQALDDISIPSTVTQIGFNAFANCKNLETIHFGGLLSGWKDIEFSASAKSQLDNCIVWFSDGTFYQKTAYEGEFTYINSVYSSLPAKYTYSCELKNLLKNSYTYQHDLTQMSIRVAMAAMGTGDGTGSENIKSLMDDMGFRYTKNSISYDTPDGDTIGYAIGRKKILDANGSENTLILVAVRGGGYGNEWAGNFNVGMGTNHAGFETAAQKVKQGLSDFINEEGITTDESVHVWICGYSRAAATSNLLAAKLNVGEIPGIFGRNVHAFCFECPQNTTDTKAHNSTYNNIVNVVNPIDLVPMVAPNNNFLWKYTRYGQTYVLPSYNNTIKYNTLKKNMESTYKDILNYRGDSFKAEYTDVALLQSEQYKNIVNNLTVFVTSPKEYTVELQTEVYKAVYDYFTDDTIPDLGDIFNILWRTILKVGISSINLSARKYYESVIETTLLNVAVTHKNIRYAHYPELCLAWVDSLDGDQFKIEYSYEKVYINCPVNVEIYENSTLVGAIYNDIPQEIADGIETYIDDNGQKVLVLPGDGDYEIKLTSYDEGEVTYTVATYDDTVSTPNQLVSYYKVGVEDENILTGIVNASEVSLKHKDGQTLTPDINQSGDEIQPCILELVSEGDGTAIGGGAYNLGEYVKVIAMADEGEQFLGWSIDGDIVSTDEEYRILMDGDKKVTAMFTEAPGGLWISGVDENGYEYTGAAIKPTVEVYDGKTLLKEKVDYVISYSNNTKVADKDSQKAPTITVTGKGNYTSKETVTFSIIAKNIDDEDVSIADVFAAQTGKVQKPVPTVTWQNRKLSNKKDFVVSYPDLEDSDGTNAENADAYKNAGDYRVIITGINNFVGEREITFHITTATLMSKVKVKAIPKQTYTGSAIEPALTVTYGKETLNLGTDYAVSYRNNIQAGKATAVIMGKGDYAGTKEVTFQIVGTSISKATVNGLTDKVYNGQEQTQNIQVQMDGKTLTLNKDYQISYTKNLNAGTATVTITGIGGYSGTLKKKFKITAYDLSADESRQMDGFPKDGLSVAYTKGGSTPEVSLSFGGTELTIKKDYTVTYSNNKKITGEGDTKTPTITIKGKGNFKGTKTISFTITKRNLNAAENLVTIHVPDMPYVNKAGKYISKPVLTDINGKKLAAGTDYDKNVTYTLVSVGKADNATAADGADGGLQPGAILDKTSIPTIGSVIKVTITGKGNYEGTMEATYRIAPASFSSAKITIEPQIYTGSSITLAEKDITVKLGKDTLLTYGKDYEIVEGSYQNNVKKGTASVMTKGMGDYAGTKTVKFKITSKKLVWFWKLFQ